MLWRSNITSTCSFSVKILHLHSTIAFKSKIKILMVLVLGDIEELGILQEISSFICRFTLLAFLGGGGSLGGMQFQISAIFLPCFCKSADRNWLFPLFCKVISKSSYFI